MAVFFTRFVLKDLVSQQQSRRCDSLEANRAEAFGYIRLRIFHDIIHY